MCGLPYPIETDWGKPRGTGVGSMGGSKASKDSLFKVKSLVTRNIFNKEDGWNRN